MSPAQPPPAQPQSEGEPFEPLTGIEQRRLQSLLGDISTHTLLHSLTGMKRDSEDARLIIAALLQRIPDPDQAPVIPT